MKIERKPLERIGRDVAQSVKVGSAICAEHRRRFSAILGMRVESFLGIRYKYLRRLSAMREKTYIEVMVNDTTRGCKRELVNVLYNIS